MTVRPRILVHGGAGEWLNFDDAAVMAGVRSAARVGWEVLQAGGTALEAVERAVILLEDDPLFDAGYGSFVNEQGEVEMDALIADGETITFGAVAAVRRVQNAITLARLVMTHTKHCFFAGEGADQLAVELGIPLIPNMMLVTEKEYAQFRERVGHVKSREALGTGTVGAVAIDAQGHIASATSTGGTPDKKKGRVGDSPIFGAGGYADDRAGAASATGQGEQIMRFFLCKEAVDASRNGLDASAAVSAAIEHLSAHISDPNAGIIMVDAAGRLGAAHTTRAMPIAWVDEQGIIDATMQAKNARF